MSKPFPKQLKDDMKDAQAKCPVGNGLGVEEEKKASDLAVTR